VSVISYVSTSTAWRLYPYRIRCDRMETTSDRWIAFDDVGDALFAAEVALMRRIAGSRCFLYQM